MCIRALDYIPPVDITFGEYLRGIITADADLVEDDRYNYRVAFIEAFRKRGIYPLDLDTLSVDTLRWQGVEIKMPRKQASILLRQLKRYADKCFYIASRENLFNETRTQRKELHFAIAQVFDKSPELASQLGLDPHSSFEVHALRRSMRIGPDGQHMPQIIMALTQSRQLKIDGASDPVTFRGGSTLVIDLSKVDIQYAIIKRIDSETRIDGKTREERTAAFLNEAFRDPLQRLLLAPGNEPFAALHSLANVT
jgi:hypothetical protein